MSSLDLSDNILPVFVTPVVNYLWPNSADLNAELQAYILECEKSEKGLSKSVVGGWHSELDMLARDAAPIAQLRERLWVFTQALLKQFSQSGETFNFRIEGWGNVLRHGQYHSMHAHPNATWSGCYYVNGNDEVEDQPFSGRFELIDPRPAASLNYAESSNLYGRFLLNPNPGQMIVFPSWMQHQVHPYFGDGERITVAFNVLL
ncbi:MAG: 2OG-Fe(II) oxygenase family protein [Candidatus Thiodiazotropha sp. (ex. Lucinisca nassula)]|nr:2OG-Fe(II) oxygenase family protein [Candidatus Thiodiazotropha sp. (ex. Lucinisca nassula)]